MPSRQGIVELTLRDGRTLRHHTMAVRGTAENPMTRAEVDAKSYDLLAPVLGKARARKLCDAIWNLEKLRDVRKLRPLADGEAMNRIVHLALKVEDLERTTEFYRRCSASRR